MAGKREQVGQVIRLDEARRKFALEPAEEPLMADRKGKILRMLDMQPQESSFLHLLRTALNKNDSIQKILPEVNKAAKDIGLDASDPGARLEAMQALISFSEDLDAYHEVRMTCKDKSNQLAAALGDLVVFTHGFDDELNQRLCEAHKKVLAFDGLRENEADNRKSVKKTQIAAGTGTAASVSLAVAIAVSADSLYVFGGILVPLLSAAYSFYALRKRRLEERFKERKEKLELDLKGVEEDD